MSHTTLRVLLICVALSANVIAGEWPQWAGPDRDFTAVEVALADRWPTKGPPRLWSRKLGVGYSGIVVTDRVLYTMYRKSRTDAVEYTVALDASTGKTIWEFENPSPLVGPPAEPSDSRWGGQGPNATPLIVGDRLFTMGSRAVMNCHDRKTGKVLWKRDLAEEFGATQAGRQNNDTGYGASPIAYRNSVIVPLGRSRVKSATRGQSLVALDQADGRVLWKRLDFDYSFSSPVLIEIDGRDQLVLNVKNELIGVDPNDGCLLWSHPLTSDWDPTITPVWDRERSILVKDGDKVCPIELTTKDGKTSPREAWSSSEMNVAVPTPVLVGERFYGSTRTVLVAVSVKTGERAWTARGFPMASAVHAGGKLILLDEKYSLTAPALVGTTLFVRDRKHILALDLE